METHADKVSFRYEPAAMGPLLVLLALGANVVAMDIFPKAEGDYDAAETKPRRNLEEAAETMGSLGKWTSAGKNDVGKRMVVGSSAYLDGAAA